MTTWGRELGPNDDSTIPGTVIIVEVATTAERDAVNPKRLIHRWHSGYMIGGRFEGEAWTREKTSCLLEPASFWSTVNSWRQTGKPTWIISSDLSKALTLLGAWNLLDTSILSLCQKPFPVSPKIRSQRLRRQRSRVIPGLLIDADPPTALIVFHRDRWKMICLDLRNFFPGQTPRRLATDPDRPDPTKSAPDQVTTFEDELREAAGVTLDHFRRLCLWHRKLGLGHFSLTIAGMSLAAFRHKWMGHKIELPPSQADRDFERQAYYGGRTEALWIGEIAYGRYRPAEGVQHDATLFQTPPRGPFHLVDARSFYGAVMAFQSLPFRCTGEGDGWPPGDRIGALQAGDILAHVRISTDTEEFPIRLPDRTVYAVGDFWTYLCGPELARAYSAGVIKDVGHWREYETALVFREYSLRLWEERREAERVNDRILSGLIKGMIARLHGKFGQRLHKWQTAVDVEAPARWHRWHIIDHETGAVTHYRSLGDSVQFQTAGGDAKHCFPALSAFVTAWGREYLRTWVRIAGRGNVLYLSTDSLIVTDAGRVNLENHGIIGNHGIGSCRVQETSDSLYIGGTNHTRIGNHVCFAGLPGLRLDCSGRTASYTTRNLLRSSLTRLPQQSVAEIEQVATINPREETHRVGAGGWLSRVRLSLEDDSCQLEVPALPTLTASL